MNHHVLHDVGGEDAKLRISDAYREDFVTIEEHYYDRAELASALGLVTREAWAKTNDALRTERDAAEATIARVRAWYGANQNRDAWSDGKQWRAARESLRAALDPKPTFVLPTEPGARFFATDPNGDPVEFVVYGSGSDYRVFRVVGRWEFHDAGAVMSEFTDHHLIGAES